MPLATDKTGVLQPITDCYIEVTDGGQLSGNKITARVLPEITDSKTANYADEPILGRSFPAKTFGHGENRTVTINWHFVLLKEGDASDALGFLRKIQSLVYPLNAKSPYAPPLIVKLKCGQLLSKEPLCAVLKSYSVNFPTEVPWAPNTYLPYKFDVNMSFDIVYATSELPGQEMIIMS
jgi:hypothetical protein